jgi:rhomboid protease GluP
MDHRRMCPHCRAFITTRDRVCPYCNEEVGPRAAEQRLRGSGFLHQGNFVTLMILLINTALYAATLLATQGQREGFTLDPSGQVLVRFGGKYGPLILLRAEWWRLLTAGFLHGGIFHIAMNSWALMDLGAQVEELFGPYKMVVFYVVTTIAGFVASTWWSPMQLSIGASAGLFGLIGVMIAVGVQSKTILGATIRGMYIRWAVYGLLFGLIPGFRVDNAAHIGGLVSGFAVAWLAGLPSLTPRPSDRLWQVLCGLSLVLTAWCFFQMYLSLSTPLTPR